MDTSPEKRSRIAQVLAECERRLKSGNQLDEQVIFGQFPDLLPELREQLKLLQEAHRRTSNPSASVGDQVSTTLHHNARIPSPTARSASVRVRYVGDYELLEEIGRGGMGVVFRARQVSLNRVVAVKMIRAGEMADEEEIKRFYAEAEAAAHLEHPNIVPIYEVGQHENMHYFSMAYVSGRSLHEVLREGPLPAKKAAEYLSKVSHAIGYAHERGVLHRDLKPHNILIDDKDEPRVTDFGLAKKVGSTADMTVTGQILGTPSYMSPEQALADHSKIGPASDVYSLGATLYACITGRPPFQAENAANVIMLVINQEPVAPRTLNPQLDRDVETIALKAMDSRKHHFERTRPHAAA